MTNEELQKRVGTNIREVRTHENITQVELAKKLACSPKQVRSWESGKALPSTNNLIKLCDVFNLPPFAFFMDRTLKEFFR